MKKFYMILAAVAAMTLSAQAQQEQYGVIEVGDYDGATEVYNGSFFDMAPTNFYLAHTGTQMIYTPNELSDLDGLSDVKITGLKFKFNNEGAFEDITRDVKICLQEIDETEFAVVEGVKQFFTFGDPVIEVEAIYPMLDFYGDDYEVEIDLSDAPFAFTPGKSLLVTAVFDAQDDENCTNGSVAPFYTTNIRSQAMTYTDNWTSFLEFAQGDDFPDATSMLGCGTNVNLPVTRILYSHSVPTSIEEVAAAQSQDDTYYNLMGQKFSAGNLPAGIYIHNGKKVVVK